MWEELENAFCFEIFLPQVRSIFLSTASSEPHFYILLTYSTLLFYPMLLLYCYEKPSQSSPPTNTSFEHSPSTKFKQPSFGTKAETFFPFLIN